MSSKNADHKLPLSHSWSISTRLTALYAAFAFALLLLSTGFLYWQLAKTLEQEDRQLVLAEIRDLRIVLREHPDDAELLTHEIQREGGGPVYAPRYSRVLDASGKTLIEATDMEPTLTSRRFPPPMGIEERTAAGAKWRADDGRRYLLAAAWATLGASPSPDRQIQVALDISREDILLSAYRRRLAAVLLLGSVLSGALGALVARRGLRPLLEITESVERISAASLHERVGEAPWPKELTALAQAFDRMLARLSDAFNRLSQFSADLAHELRNPVNNLMGETEVALTRNRSNEEYRKLLESNMEEYEKLARIIDSLLFLARSENAQTPLTALPMDARRELEVIREYYQPAADEQAITLICVGQGSIQADAVLFKRAVGNLVSNALHYTPRGGNITFSVQETEDQGAEVSVKDTGCGIAAKHIPKLFDRFYRVDASRSRQPEGMGLGLAIVKSIMDLHGGTVTVNSAPGQGTSVILHFPGGGLLRPPR